VSSSIKDLRETAKKSGTTLPVKNIADMRPKDQIAYLLEQKKSELQKMLPKTLSIERLMKVATIAATTTPALAKCDVPSLVAAIGQCAQLGLEPNTVLGHCYLVPFNTKRRDAHGAERFVNSVQVVIGYKGLMTLARRSGSIASISAHEVREGDKLDLSYGTDERLVHVPAMTGRGNVIGFYAVAKMKDGSHSFDFMFDQEVQSIMLGTQSKGKYGPWRDHYVAMGIKTALRRLCKLLPLSIELATAAALDDLADANKDQCIESVDGEFLITENPYAEPVKLDQAAVNEVVDHKTGEITQNNSNSNDIDADVSHEEYEASSDKFYGDME
jgi:recombination protein RecT